MPLWCFIRIPARANAISYLTREAFTLLVDVRPSVSCLIWRCATRCLVAGALNTIGNDTPYGCHWAAR